MFTKRSTTTKKNGCDFTLRGKEGYDGQWTLTVECGIHNHDLALYGEGHPLGKLTADEYLEVCESKKSNVRPNDILSKLRRRDENNVSTQRHIQNALIKFQLHERQGRSPLQQFLKLLKDNNYYFQVKRSPDSNVVGDIFFSHPVAYNLLNCFPYVIQGDCTYNTNCYGLSFLQIVGFTSTGKNFTVAYAFLDHERIESYRWVLNNLRNLFQENSHPIVFYTDADQAFVSAVRSLFPETKHHLCRRHLEVNVRKKALEISGNKEFSESYMRKFNHAISAPNVKLWMQRWGQIENDYASYPRLLNYTKSQWINRYFEAISSIYTDHVLHFGTNTTNRVESEHNRLKKALNNTHSAFDTVFHKANEVMKIQIIKIKESMELSKSRLPVDMIGEHLFDDILGKVSHVALDLVRNEMRRNEQQSIGSNADLCGCYYRRTHGIPCSHEIALSHYLGRSIRLHDFHDFWRKLDIEIDASAHEPFITSDDMQQAWTELQNAPPTLQRQLFRSINESLHPELSNLELPQMISDQSSSKKTSSTRILSGWELTAQNYGVSHHSTSGKSSRCSTIASSQFSQMSPGSISNGSPMNTSSPTTPATPSTPMTPATPSTPMTPATSATPTSRPPKSPGIIKGGISKPGRGRGRGRGRARGQGAPVACLQMSQYSSDLIPFIIPCVRGFRDVKADGNCGYRAVALQIYGNENQWPLVRKDCVVELMQNQDFYNTILPGIDAVTLITQISHAGDGVAPTHKWMSLPEVGHVIATKYNVVFLSYGLAGGITCLPAYVKPGNGPPTDTLVVGHVSASSHFILLQMEDVQIPMAPPALYWEDGHDPSADNLIAPYRSNIVFYNQLLDAMRP